MPVLSRMQGWPLGATDCHVLLFPAFGGLACWQARLDNQPASDPAAIEAGVAFSWPLGRRGGSRVEALSLGLLGDGANIGGMGRSDHGRSEHAVASGPVPGDLTLESYEEIAAAYATRDAARHPSLVRFLDLFVAAVGDGTALELGSGPGVDADYLESSGVRIIRSDGAAAFVEMMRSRGQMAHQLDVRRAELGGPYDGVLANAVLLHLTRPQLIDVLRRVRSAVRAGGVFAITVKERDGEEWTTSKVGRPRYFTYWRETPLREALLSAGWSVQTLEHVAGPEDDWIHVLAR